MSRRFPPLNSIRVFEDAAQHKSFVRATEELHVFQQPLASKSSYWKISRTHRALPRRFAHGEFRRSGDLMIGTPSPL